MNGEKMICGGTGRLPQTPSGATTLLTVEVEVDRLTRSVTAIFVNPEFQGLQRLLESALVGHAADAIAVVGQQAINSRYYSPPRNAARAALLHIQDAFAQFEKKAATPVPREWELPAAERSPRRDDDE
ncbi:MAG: hypothetical protein ABR978_06325 [Dehalococcoidia bacterium]